MTISFKIEGLDKLAAKLKSLEDLKFLKAIMRAAGEAVKKKIATYPPASEANQPNSRRWYERGYGPRWIVRSGEVHGSKTSETLGRSWTTAVKDQGLTVEVGAHASYAPYVQDREQQAWFHKARGWRTVQDVVEEDGERIANQVREALEKKLNA